MLLDKRRTHGTIWNVESLSRQFGIAAPDFTLPNSPELDAFVYTGYRKGGDAFLRAIDGRFACAFFDNERRVLFLSRDWIGETPLHWQATRRGFVVANTLADIRDAAGDQYCYRYVRAFPQSKFLEIDLSNADENCVAETCRFTNDALYFDFAAECEAAIAEDSVLSTRLTKVHDCLFQAVHRRAAGAKSASFALLLSGGLDSLSVGVALRSWEIPFIAYTLSVEGGGEDLQLAREFARHLGVEHRIVTVTRADVLDIAPDVMESAETYHAYNYYCSVGMCLLGRQLAADGVTTAFCGEAVNEAIGDYHDWVVTDPATGKSRVLQHVNFKRMSQSRERLLYVWGQARDRGKYNHQLGTGLAKHAGARMVKPFLHAGLTLECPYYDRSILSQLVSLDAAEIDAVGGKSGLFRMMFAQEMKTLALDDALINRCKKVRLQDASEGGEGGLTPILLTAGYDQERLLRLFNERFHADLDPRLDAQRLATVAS